MTLTTITETLARHGYIARREECLALATLEHQRGIRALLLEGAPGVGKTALASAWAEATDARMVYGLLHSWSDDQELFHGVDVTAAVAGAADRVHQPGLLALAAEASMAGPVVLCLDEIDKAPERVEGLLLDALQTGRVPVRPGEHLQMRVEHLTVVLTSNGQRQLGDALLRRCTRVTLRPLPAAQQDELVVARSGAPRGVVTCVAKLARSVAAAEDNDALSVDELTRLCAAAWCVAESHSDLVELLRQHAARQPQGRKAAEKAAAATAWGEIVALRRRAA